LIICSITSDNNEKSTSLIPAGSGIKPTNVKTLSASRENNTSSKCFAKKTSDTSNLYSVFIFARASSIAGKLPLYLSLKTKRYPFIGWIWCQASIKPLKSSRALATAIFLVRVASGFSGA
jgi:hypothetical protein